MTTTIELERTWEGPGGLRETLTSVDHKVIGVRYLITAGLFFLAGGLEALTMRTQLAVPRNDLLSPEAYDQLFSMHGVTMIFLFATPMLSGFGNYFVPLLIGARDMAFPRLNAFGYWIFLASGLFLYSSFLFGLAPNDGWFNYVPLAQAQFTPDRNIDFYALGLLFLTISTTVGAVNFIVTIFALRAPGMSIARLPLFCWAVLATSFSVVFALPALTVANLLLELERKWDWHFYGGPGGDAVLWQHLFWIFGHPDVYIIFLPAVGIVSSIVPVFCRRPMVGYTWVATATLATAILGFGVWVHHMFAVGLPQVSMTFFAATSFVIAIPSGVQVFAWLATALTGRPVLATPFLFVLGFLLVFVIGGLTGVMFAVVPFDQQVTDSYFVVAHFHYVLFGGAVFPMIAGLYYWLPKMTGRMPIEPLGRWSFWLVFTGFNLTFFPMHISGLLGMPRRVYTYPGDLGWDAFNLLSTLGAFTLAVGIVAVVANVLLTVRAGAPSGPDPWGGNTLEWTTTSPPPHYDFERIPVVRSADPAWDARSAPGPALADGHKTLQTSVLDAEHEEALEMPPGSPWPILLTLALTLLFVGLLVDVTAFWVAGAAASAGALFGWHLQRARFGA